MNPKEIKEETMRAGGKGGQHQNVTDSAVMLTHIPTKTIVKVRTERCQHMNRANAYAILKTKLFEMKMNETNSDRSRNRTSQASFIY